MSIPVCAEWDAESLTVKEAAHLRPGDVIRFPKTVLGQTRVRLSNTCKFRGEVGLDNNRVAVKINEKLEEKDENQ